MKKAYITLTVIAVLLVTLIASIFLLMRYNAARAVMATPITYVHTTPLPKSMINNQPVFKNELANISESDRRDLIALSFVMLRLQLRTETWYLTMNNGLNDSDIFNVDEIDSAIVLINLSPDIYTEEVALINRLYDLHKELFKLYKYPTPNRMQGLQNLAYFDIIESIERDAISYPFLYEYWDFLNPIENHTTELADLQIRFEETFDKLPEHSQENLFYITFRELYIDTVYKLSYYGEDKPLIGNGQTWLDIISKGDSDLGRTLAYQLGHLSPDTFSQYIEASELMYNLLDLNTKLSNLYFGGIRYINDIELLKYRLILSNIVENASLYPNLFGFDLLLDESFIYD